MTSVFSLLSSSRCKMFINTNSEREKKEKKKHILCVKQAERKGGNGNMYIQKNTQKQKRLKNVPRIFRKTLFLTYPYFPGTRNITIAEDFDSRAIKSVTRKRAILIRFL